MIKIIKGKGNYKYFCPKCKTTFETDGEELKECPVCNKEDTYDNKVKQIREKIEKIAPADNGRNYALEAFEWLAKTAVGEDKQKFENKMTRALESDEEFDAFVFALFFFAPYLVMGGELKKGDKK